MYSDADFVGYPYVACSATRAMLESAKFGPRLANICQDLPEFGKLWLMLPFVWSNLAQIRQAWQSVFQIQVTSAKFDRIGSNRSRFCQAWAHLRACFPEIGPNLGFGQICLASAKIGQCWPKFGQISANPSNIGQTWSALFEVVQHWRSFGQMLAKLGGFAPVVFVFLKFGRCRPEFARLGQASASLPGPHSGTQIAQRRVLALYWY